MIIVILGVLTLAAFLYGMLSKGALEIFSYIYEFGIMAIVGILIGTVLYFVISVGVCGFIAAILLGWLYEFYCIIFKSGENPIVELFV